MNVLIVESPNKAKNIASYLKSLPDKWTVMATGGHVRDLSKDQYGVYKDSGRYKGEWQVAPSKKNTLAKLREARKTAKQIYIATDDDREGAGIAEDLVELLNLKNYNRVIFLEITKKSILSALTNKQSINRGQAEARKARRIIDRIIGYTLSPAIKYDFKNTGISHTPRGIGRVSFAALSLIVKRHKDIQEFTPVTKDGLIVNYRYKDQDFKCTLVDTFFKQDHEQKISAMTQLRNGFHIVSDYRHEPLERHPVRPVIATTLYTSAWYLFNMETQETAKVAQSLFEGVEINGVTTGLITYPRTDSYRLNLDIVNQINMLIPTLPGVVPGTTLGKEYVHGVFRDYDKRKGAQDAHEAIRPTSFDMQFTPKQVKQYLTEQEYDIYRYIWIATVASQMASARYTKTDVLITCGDLTLKGDAEVCEFKGWEVLAGYIQNAQNARKPKFSKIPQLKYGQELQDIQVDEYETTTKAPPRYSLGTILSSLDSLNIGRPSTIPNIIPDLLSKEYIKNIDKGMLFPLELGVDIIEWAENRAPWLIDKNHVGEFEAALQGIEEGEGDSNLLISEYDNLVDEVIKLVGYTPNRSNSPSLAQIELVKKLANETGMELPDIESKKEVQKFLNSQQKAKTLHRCVACKEGDVVENAKGFCCNNSNCDFAIWKKSIYSFLSHHKIPSHDVNLRRIIEGALKKRYCAVKGLNGKKGPYNATLGIKKDDKYGWQLSFHKFISSDEADAFIQRAGFDLLDQEASSQSSASEQLVNLASEKQLDIDRLLNENQALKNEKRMLTDSLHKDVLTRAQNRLCFDKDVKRIFNNNYLIFGAFIDIDFFKKVNDNHGHQAGDAALVSLINCCYANFTDAMKNTCRIYRYGGEEFIILFSTIAHDMVFKYLESLRLLVKNTVIVHENKELTITISTGASKRLKDDTDKTFLKRIDSGVYQAKHNGRDQVVWL
jgi:DNA topoisomerase I